MSDPLLLLDAERIAMIAREMVAIPSVTGHEHAISDWTAGFLGELGLPVTRLAVPEAGDTLVARVPGGSGRPLMFNLHLDTFDVSDGWETDPLVPTVRGDRLYGLGAHDMKGGAACALAAVEAIVRSGVALPRPLLVSATTDEENWSRGAHALIDSGALADCAGCLVPEPSPFGTLTIGQRGRHVFRVRFFGATAHAAFGGGVNAVVDAARVAAYLATPGSVDLGQSDFGISGTLTVTGLHGGGDMILVPERAELVIDRHILPGETLAHASAQIHAAIAAASVEGRYELAVDERPTPAPGPFLVAPTHPLVRHTQAILAEEQGSDITFRLGLSVADTSHIAVHGGVPTLICGPTGGNTCAANEWLDLSSLLPIARTYVRVACAEME